MNVSYIYPCVLTGIQSKAVQVIHSAPGSKDDSNLRMLRTMRENIPKHWSVKRTTSGSMTRAVFADWTKYFVGVYPFFIASHTSAWVQPNDCGLNAR